MGRYWFLLLLLMGAMQSFSQSASKKGTYYVVIDSVHPMQQTAKGSILKGYYERDTIQKIECWFGFQFGDLRRVFYFWQGRLIMVTEEQRLYDANAVSRENTDTVKPNYDGRYLFTDDKLTNLKQNGSFSFLDTPADKTSMQNTFLQMAADYQAMLDIARTDKNRRIKLKKSKKQ
jgi:hypothetical protein